MDPDADAQAAALENARLNHVKLRTGSDVPEAWDLLLAADVLYEPEILDWLASQPTRARRVFVADPERSSAPLLPGEPLLRVGARTFPDVDSPQKSAAIFELRR